MLTATTSDGRDRVDASDGRTRWFFYLSTCVSGRKWEFKLRSLESEGDKPGGVGGGLNQISGDLTNHKAYAGDRGFSLVAFNFAAS